MHTRGKRRETAARRAHRQALGPSLGSTFMPYNYSMFGADRDKQVGTKFENRFPQVSLLLNSREKHLKHNIYCWLTLTCQTLHEALDKQIIQSS